MSSYFHYRIFRDVFTNILPYNFLDGPMFCTCMKWAWKMIQWYFGHLMMDRCFARTWSERKNQLNHVITTVDTVIFRSFNDRIIKVLMKYKGWLSDVSVNGGKINAYSVGICMNKQNTRVPLSLQKWSKLTLRESIKNLVTFNYLETFANKNIFLKKIPLTCFLVNLS